MGSDPNSHVRLGLRLVGGLRRDAAQRIVAARAQRPFGSVDDLARRARLDAGQMAVLAAADALASLSGHRRQQVWDAAALKAVPALLQEAPVDEAPLVLPEAPHTSSDGLAVWIEDKLLPLRGEAPETLAERLPAL